MLSRRFMISVGSTREPADAIRLWTNVFTGDSLLPFVRRLSEHGSVDLLSSSAAHAAALRELRARVEVSQYGSTSELRALMQAKFESRAYDCVFLAAAAKNTPPISSIAAMLRPNSGHWSPARNTVCKLGTR